MSYIGAVVTLSCWCIPEAIDVAFREEEIESSAAEFEKLCRLVDTLVCTSQWSRRLDMSTSGEGCHLLI